MTQDEDRKHETMLDAMRATVRRLSEENEKLARDVHQYLQLVAELGVDWEAFDTLQDVQTAALATIHAFEQNEAASHQRNALLLALGFSPADLSKQNVAQRNALKRIAELRATAGAAELRRAVQRKRPTRKKPGHK